MRPLYGDMASREIRGPIIQNETPRTLDDQPLSAWRRLPLPVSPLTLTTGASGVITVAPQSVFKVVRINIPTIVDDTTGAPIAGIFLTDVKVGQASQFIASGNVDIQNLSPAAVSSFLDFDTGKVGNVFSMHFLNTSAGTVTISPMVICEVARPGNSV